MQFLTGTIFHFHDVSSNAECGISTPVGVAEDTKVANDQITASSSYWNGRTCCRPWQGRLNNNKHWSTDNQYPSDPWIKVEFYDPLPIKGITTQGAATTDKLG